jgi:hypothetical protein
MKITSDLTNLTTAMLILTAQMFFEWTLNKSVTELTRRTFKNQTSYYRTLRQCNKKISYLACCVFKTIMNV